MDEICKDIKHKDKAFTYINYERNCPYCRIAELEAEINKTYKAHCGRDLMHLPLNAAVGVRITELEQQLAESKQMCMNNAVSYVSAVRELQAQNAKLIGALEKIKEPHKNGLAHGCNSGSELVEVMSNVAAAALKEVNGE